MSRIERTFGLKRLEQPLEMGLEGLHARARQEPREVALWLAVELDKIGWRR